MKTIYAAIPAVSDEEHEAFCQAAIRCVHDEQDEPVNVIIMGKAVEDHDKISASLILNTCDAMRIFGEPDDFPLEAKLAEGLGLPVTAGALDMTATAIYTHDEAADIASLFEDILFEHDIRIPDACDDERDPDDKGLYGDTYSGLTDGIEERLVEILDRRAKGAPVVPYVFSGTR